MSKSGISLHPELGLNPRMTTCWCGNAGEEILLLGSRNNVFVCSACSLLHIGLKKAPKKCFRCKQSEFNKRDLSESEKLPRGSGECSECRESRESMEQEVQKGGVLFKCSACNRRGAIKAGTWLAKEVRKHANVEPPHPVGVDLEECPICKDDMTQVAER